MRTLIAGCAAALGAAMLAGCTYPPGSDTLPAPLPNLAEQQGNPRLALLDHVLSHHFAEAGGVMPIACATVNDGRSAVALPQDEETALMERHATLAPFARCTLQDGHWRDDDDGDDATLITLHSFTCASRDSCTGWAASQTGATAAMSMRYSMEWGARGWSFTRDPRLILDP